MAQVRIEVVEKVVTMKEQEQAFLTTKSLMAYLGGVSKDFVEELRKSGELPYYKLRSTFLYKVSDVRSLVERNRIY